MGRPFFRGGGLHPHMTSTAENAVLQQQRMHFLNNRLDMFGEPQPNNLEWIVHSRRTLLSFSQYQITLLDERGTCLWIIVQSHYTKVKRSRVEPAISRSWFRCPNHNKSTVLQHVNNRESVGREAKLLLLTEIRATAAPLAAWGVTSWLSAVNKR